MNGVQSEINVTPLVDVVLVLLIIFMVVTPMMTPHNVQLPATKQPAKAPQELHKTIYLTSSDTLFYEEEPVIRETLVARLQELHQRHPQTRILLHADRRLTYDKVMEVVSLISGSGFVEIGLIAKPVERAHSSPIQ